MKVWEQIYQTCGNQMTREGVQRPTAVYLTSFPHPECQGIPGTGSVWVQCLGDVETGRKAATPRSWGWDQQLGSSLASVC